MMTCRTTTALASRALSASKTKSRHSLFYSLLAFATALIPVCATAQNLPTGGTVVHGNATITTPNANNMIINQGSDRAVVNWNGFSVGAGNRVDINQPSVDSSILNRVTGDTTSQIHGQINANGRVFVVNPNGIFIGTTGSVNTGSFVASTLGIRTDDFVTGQTVFEGNGSSATVSNAGQIQVVTGGYAALIGGKVKNSGTIQAPLGFVGLGSGERITLDLAGDGFLQVALPTNSDDDSLDALIENSGTIQANGGTVQMSAATARNAARHAINMSGVVEARTVSGRSGRITLGGGAGGKVSVTGKLRTKTRSRPAIQVTQSARPALRPEHGGDITITGHDIALGGAEIDASGTNGGGSIRIGGAFQGGPSLPTATSLTVDATSIIKANGIENGNGGRVVLWSDDRTEFAGNITARGGSLSGNGGFVEVSGKRHLAFSGLADTTAENGAWGTLLLDPNDIFIVAALTGDDGDILASTIESALAVNNAVEILSTSGAGPDEGRIEVNAPLTWTTNSTLSLIADIAGPPTDDSIVINAPITATNGYLRLSAFETVGTGPAASRFIATGQDGDINVGTFEIAIGDWVQHGDNFPVSGLPSFEARNFVLGNDTSFLRATAGDGGATPYSLVDIYGVQGISGNTNYQLADTIDATGTQFWESLDPLTNGVRNSGFVPLNFNGDLEGNRNVIANLFIRQYPSAGGLDDTGLFSSVGDNARLMNFSILDADVAGENAGILAGFNGGFNSGIRATGTVVAYGEYGGGLNAFMPFGQLLNSSANANVSDGIDPSDALNLASGQVSLGGLVGASNFGDVISSKSAGSVTVSFADEAFAGGLVGTNADIIRNVYSETSVTVTAGALTNEATIGGIVGENATNGTITNAIATGAVTLEPGCCAGFGLEGGIAGEDDPSDESILSSFWNFETTGQGASGQNGETFGDTNGLGQFEGAFAETTASLRDAELFSSVAVVSGWDFGNVWAIPQDGVDMARLYTVDPVISASDPTETEPDFQYNGTTTGFSAVDGQFFGGPADYLFGPLGDTGDLTIMEDQIILSDANVGPVTFTFPTSYTSDMGQVFDVRSLPKDANVVPAPLTVTVNDTFKTYGEVLTFAGVDYTATTLFAGDTITGADVNSAGAPATATVVGSPYTLNLSNLTGSGLGNYNISIVPGRLQVVQRGLSVVMNDATKTYGEQLLFNGTEFTSIGLINGDTLTSISITSDGAASTAQVADGPFSIEGSAPVGSGIDNYALSFTPGTLTINPAPLTITAEDQSKPFGTEFTFTGTEFTVVGLLNSDEVTEATLTSNSASAEAPFTGPGGEAIFITDPQGSGLDNYHITLVNGVFIVAPGNLTITALDQTKIYGSDLVFDGTEFSVVGLAEGDSVDSVTLVSAGAAGTAQVTDGPFAIVASDAVGTGLEKYSLVFADGSLTVIPAPLSVTALDQTKQQGQLFTFSGSEFATSGLFNDDAVTSATFSSAGADADAQADDSPFAITVDSVTGTGLDNYDISTTNGTMTVQDNIAPPQVNPVPGGNTTITNPPDAITISFPDTGGSADLGGTQTRRDGTGGPTQTVPQAKATNEAVDDISTELELQVQSCGGADQDFDNYMACLSDSLDTYSNALDEIVNDLPAGLETVSATIRTASDSIKASAARAQRRLAGATTDAQRRAIRRDAVNEARGAINEAKSEIRKAISLIRADDPEVTSIQRDTGARIIQAFDAVDSSLVRAVEL
ncbi:MBG domain-containing protein [Sulfitobacter sp. F26204]|uniref:MBG domain-containing protein n=1 Tax=Sulfitobacter sp. F26204 TaxID=2996014 RepID=UPI00225E53DF|nr:MBG domain-containing protein [Sulfitobacter sp. F26204]MCX7561219.1 MBG domain-containing protein [Sulfitobacter sp. F26204]